MDFLDGKILGGEHTTKRALKNVVVRIGILLTRTGNSTTKRSQKEIAQGAVKCIDSADGDTKGSNIKGKFYNN